MEYLIAAILLVVVLLVFFGIGRLVIGHYDDIDALIFVGISCFAIFAFICFIVFLLGKAIEPLI